MKMKFMAFCFILGAMLLLSACPVRNAYDKTEYHTQSSYNAIFKGQSIPNDKTKRQTGEAPMRPCTRPICRPHAFFKRTVSI